MTSVRCSTSHAPPASADDGPLRRSRAGLDECLSRESGREPQGRHVRRARGAPGGMIVDVPGG